MSQGEAQRYSLPAPTAVGAVTGGFHPQQMSYAVPASPPFHNNNNTPSGDFDYRTTPYHRGNYQQPPPSQSAQYWAAESPGRRNFDMGQVRRPDIWAQGSGPTVNRNINEGFRHVETTINRATPPLVPPERGNNAFTPDQTQYLISMFKQMMLENEQNSIQRENARQNEYIQREQALLKELQDAKQVIQQLQQKIYHDRDNFHSQQQQHFERQWPPPTRFQRRWYPYPTHSPDTENTNKYLDSTANLIEADKENKSMAPEGMQCEFIEHFGEEEGNLLLAQQTVKYQAVSSDLQCSKGLAKQFAEKLGKPSKQERQPIGTVLTQEADGMGVVKSIITKRRFFHKFPKKPEVFITEMEMALHKMADDIIENNYKEVAIPRICSGLDGLNWLWVKDRLQNFLKDSSVKVHVYNMRRRPLRDDPILVETDSGPPAVIAEEHTTLRAMPQREGRGQNSRFDNFVSQPLK
jgi:hypothetical protein